MYMKRKTKYK